MNEGFFRINFFTKMVIVFLKSLIFERLSFRFLQQEKKVLLEIKNPSFTQSAKVQTTVFFVLCIPDKEFLLYHADREMSGKLCFGTMALVTPVVNILF